MATKQVERINIAHSSTDDTLVLDQQTIAGYLNVASIPPLNQPGGFQRVTVYVKDAASDWHLEAKFGVNWCAILPDVATDANWISHGAWTAGVAGAGSAVLPPFAAEAYRIKFAGSPSASTKVHVVCER